MLCQLCQKLEASVTLKQVINGHKEVLSLCPDCAERCASAIAPSLILKFQPPPAPAEAETAAPTRKKRRGSGKAQTCKSCGSTLAQLKETGRLGCAADYTVFADEIQRLLNRVQGCTEHRGRAPSRIAAQQAQERRLSGLRAELEQAIAAEDYERAATLRDMLQCLERDGGHA